MHTQSISIRKFSNGILQPASDILAVEEPLEIRLSFAQQQRNISVTMRTPGHDAELAAGFLFTEGILPNPSAIEGFSVSENSVTVQIKPGIVPQLNNAERNFYTTSACGVCGKASINAITTVSIFGNAPAGFAVDAQLLLSLPEKLNAAQEIFKTTGGLHAAALFDAQGELLLLCEDVGRHNALDKLIGSAYLSGSLPLQQHILLLSGRASFELVQKANMAGIRVIAAVGAPSSLAVQAAEEFGITLTGFLKANRFNVYCGNLTSPVHSAGL
jgi:FdhD protein